MTTKEMIDSFSWALSMELMETIGAQLPAADRPETFLQIYARVMAGFQCFDELRNGAPVRVGTKEVHADRIDVDACRRQFAIQIQSLSNGARDEQESRRRPLRPGEVRDSRFA